VVLFTAISIEPKGEAKPGPAVRPLDQKLSFHSDPGGPNRRRILLVGFDGLDPVTLQTLMARGEMPTFSRLRREGTFARSKTLSPTASPIIWSTIATGKQPEKHGIFGFVNHTFPGLGRPIARYPEGVGYQRVTSLFTSLGLSRPIPPTRDQLTTNAIWDLVSAGRGKVAVVNWWVSWPAEKVRGVIVSDRFFGLLKRRASPEEARGATYPPALYDELVGSIDTGRSQLLADLDDAEQEALFGGFKGRSDRELLEWALAMDDTSMSVARDVLKRGPYDLVAVYLRGIDIVSHGFSNQASAQAKDLYRRKLLEGYYRQADSQLATLISLADSETDVLVCSDHGFETQPEGTYGHRDAPDGVFLLAGPDAEHGKEIARVRMADYTPTLLYLMGKPVGKDMDGRVLAEALRPDLLAARPVDYLPSYDDMPRQARLQDSSIEDEAYEDLRALGYVK
jgi:predicted AlkP superfamily phosphohydrolase/phosphomutase